jgi:hypothetical protein
MFAVSQTMAYDVIGWNYNFTELIKTFELKETKTTRG